ncbi:MAG: hypothetical protein DRO12_04740 [Thermoprotei archaeon]|nr:MAG: hypothetical protein DRO12_04740 [Thermoprotei archaeon]
MAILFLTMYNVYMFMKLATVLSSVTKETLDAASKESLLKVAEVVVFSNGTLRANVTNEGPEEVEDIASIDVIVLYTVNASPPLPATYLLSFSYNVTSNGVWTVRRVFIDNYTYSYSEHPYLMPGETVEIEALLPSAPLKGSEGLLLVSTPSGTKAKRSFIVK